MEYTVPHFINGKPILKANRKLDIYNPALGKIIGQLDVADDEMVHQAVLAAKMAFLKWSLVTPLQRAKILFKFKTLLDENKSELAKLITREHGKTLNESQGSIQRGIDVVDFACNIPKHLLGSFSEDIASNMDCYSTRQPLGVCVGITPFNFPAMIPLWMFPLAIACGNTFILKPSEKDPSSSIRLAELAKEAGVLDGVINVVQGDKETVDALLTHPDIKAISFVGSSPIADYVSQKASANHKRVQAFGGSKNHCVVMPDADLADIAPAILESAYGCAGERCMAISVVVAVGDTVADALISQLKLGIHKIEMGPLVTSAHFEKVKSYIELGKKEGAKLVVDGSHPSENGFYMKPYLFDKVTASMRIYQEEIFGPVLCIVRVSDFNQALELVNQHPFGNGAAIYTRDGRTARAFAHHVQAGMVGINVPIPVPVAHHSFGGWKNSIFGDTGMFGDEGVRFYTKLKTVTERWL